MRAQGGLLLSGALVASGVFGFLLGSEIPISARPQERPLLPAGAPDLEGGWTRIDPYGAGSYGGLMKAAEYQQAELVPGAAAAAGGRGGRGRGADNDDVAPPTKPNPVGVPYVVTTGRCGGAGRRGSARAAAAS